MGTYATCSGVRNPLFFSIIKKWLSQFGRRTVIYLFIFWFFFSKMENFEAHPFQLLISISSDSIPCPVPMPCVECQECPIPHGTSSSYLRNVRLRCVLHPVHPAHPLRRLPCWICPCACVSDASAANSAIGSLYLFSFRSISIPNEYFLLRPSHLEFDFSISPFLDLRVELNKQRVVVFSVALLF